MSKTATGAYKRGDVWLHTDNGARYCNNDTSGLQRGTRPVVIVSNDTGNKYSPVVTVAPLTSRLKNVLPTHVDLSARSWLYESTVLCEQVFTCPKSALIDNKGALNEAELKEVNNALMVALELL